MTATLVAIAAPAAAEPGAMSLTVDAPAKSARLLAKLDLRTTEHAEIATMSLALTGDRDVTTQPVEAVVMLAVPRGTRVVKMSLVGDAATPLDAVPTPVDVATRDLDHAVATPEVLQNAAYRDPALLEWVDEDRLRLRVYPVQAGHHTSVVMSLVLPHFDTLVADLGDRRIEVSRAKLEPAVDGQGWLEQEEAAVTPGVALYAAPLLQRADPGAIGRTFERAALNVERCRASTTDHGDYDPHGVVVELTVSRSGRVLHARFDGASEELTRCLGAAAAWMWFAPSEQNTDVSYALQLR